jgi:hypothetical protein
MLIWQKSSTSDLYHQCVWKDIFLEDKNTLFYDAKPKSTGFEGRAGSGRKWVKRQRNIPFVLSCRWQQNISSFEYQQISETTSPIWVTRNRPRMHM